MISADIELEVPHSAQTADLPTENEAIERAEDVTELPPVDGQCAGTPVLDQNAGTQSRAEASFNLLNNLLGAGLLAMPRAYARCGLITGFIFMVLMAYANHYTLMLVFSMSETILKDASYPKLARHIFGQRGIVAVWCSYIIFSGGCLVIYFIALSDIFSQIPLFCNFGRGGRVILAMLLCAPGAMMKTLKNVAFFSLLCVIGVFTLVTCLTFICMVELLSPPSSAPLNDSGVVEMFRFHPYDLVMAASVFALQFSIQAGGIEVLSNIASGASSEVQSRDECEEEEVDETGQPSRSSGIHLARQVSSFSYALALLFSGVIGCMGYIRFGQNVKGDFLLNFGSGDYVVLMVLVRFAYGVIVSCSFAFVMVPCRYAVLDLFRMRDDSLSTEHVPHVAFVKSTSAIFLVAGFTAWAVPDLSAMIEFVGVWSTMSLAFILPCAFLIQLRRLEGIWVLSRRNVCPIIMVFVGVAVICVSTLHFFTATAVSAVEGPLEATLNSLRADV